MRDEMGDFVQTVLYNVLGNKEENTKEKDLERNNRCFISSINGSNSTQQC